MRIVRHADLRANMEPCHVLTSYVESEGDGATTLQLSPYHGCAEVRIGRSSVTLERFAIPEMIRMLQVYEKEQRKYEAEMAKKARKT